MSKESAKRYREKNPERCAESKAKWLSANPDAAAVATKKIRVRNKRFVCALKKESVCARCGGDDWRVLEFHHRDPDDKLYSIESGGTRSLQSVAEEIEKCDTLCRNCHILVENHGETY